jgi:aryl-alcohol dehydrogenase-like predicted oxidoreductase
MTLHQSGKKYDRSHRAERMALATNGRFGDALAIRGRIGLGAMPLSTSGRPSDGQSIATLHAAFDAGVRHVDTADAYCLTGLDTGHNELLVAMAIKSWHGPGEEVVVATKGGHVRDGDGGWHTDGRPEHVIQAARASRERLQVDAIPLYYLHRPDPRVPFVESVGALVTLLEQDVVRAVGISNVTVEQAESAAQIVRVSAVQNSFSPYDLTSRAVVEWCERRDVTFVAWAPLGGSTRAGRLGDDPTTFAFAQVARDHRASTAQVVLAWLLALSPITGAIPGARRPSSIVDSVASESLELSVAELTRLAAGGTDG